MVTSQANKSRHGDKLRERTMWAESLCVLSTLLGPSVMVTPGTVSPSQAQADNYMDAM